MKSQAISFRLSDDKHRRFLGVAAAAGFSPGEYARELVIEKLDEADITRNELDGLQQEVRKMRAELAAFQSNFTLAVEALLVSNSSGQPVTVEQARRWVDERIRPGLRKEARG